MSGILEKKWYVVKVVTGQENKIKNYIDNETSRLGYADYMEEVLVPIMYDLPDREDIGEVIITEGAARKLGAPELVATSSEKTA